MPEKISTIYMNSATQAAYGTAAWATLANAADGVYSTAASCSMLADMTPATPSSYYLLQSISSIAYYSDIPYTLGSKKISKVEIGYNSSFVFGGLIAQNLTNQININNTGYQTIYTRPFAFDPVLAQLVTWIDITSITNAPSVWTDAYILGLKSRIFMTSAAETADKTDVTNVLYIYDTYVRITWSPKSSIFIMHNF